MNGLHDPWKDIKADIPKLTLNPVVLGFRKRGVTI